MTTKFSDMPAGKINRWMAWANSHDWAPGFPAWFDRETGEMVTASVEIDANDQAAVVEARHKTSADMRAWAGY